MKSHNRILFIGDSLIAFFDWQDCLPDFECVNLGVPGETVAGWLHLTAQSALRYPEAKYVVVMLGANNLCQQDYSFLPSYEALLDDLQATYPDATIIVCSLLPHELPWLAVSAIPRLNDAMRAMVEGHGHVFLDICTAFQQQTAGCFMEDGVHVSATGYKIWCDVLGDFFSECEH